MHHNTRLQLCQGDSKLIVWLSGLNCRHLLGFKDSSIYPLTFISNASLFLRCSAFTVSSISLGRGSAIMVFAEKNVRNKSSAESSYIFCMSLNLSAFGRYPPTETVPHLQMLWVKMLEYAY